VSAQAPRPEPVLVIEGATLIDGNGGVPLPDSAIVIRGNRIASVVRRGPAAYPPNAHIINATGKFVMPGLFDSQVSYGETAIPYRDAVMHGRLRGPRTFTSISRLVAEPEGFATEGGIRRSAARCLSVTATLAGV
jgi:cytosine/adenosine deaminase-related metal-dependent hydrolase